MYQSFGQVEIGSGSNFQCEEITDFLRVSPLSGLRKDCWLFVFV